MALTSYAQLFVWPKLVLNSYWYGPYYFCHSWCALHPLRVLLHLWNHCPTQQNQLNPLQQLMYILSPNKI